MPNKFVLLINRTINFHGEMKEAIPKKSMTTKVSPIGINPQEAGDVPTNAWQQIRERGYFTEHLVVYSERVGRIIMPVVALAFMVIYWIIGLNWQLNG